MHAEWHRADQQVRRYEQAILPQTSVAIDAARTAYLAGRGDFSTVIEDFRLWIDARVALTRREADRFVAWAGMQSMIAPEAVVWSRPGERTMNRRFTISRGTVWMILLAIALALTFGACGRSETSGTKYHCPMHPTYVSDRPGDCPICGMRLVKMENSAAWS